MEATSENKSGAAIGDDLKADVLRQEMADSSYDGEDQKTAFDDPASPEEAAAVLRKIDWYLVPVLVLVNAIQLIDKNVRYSSSELSVEKLTWFVQTLSSAATYGMIQQANLRGQEYSLLVTLFYIGYLVAEYPSNYLMQKFPTGKYLTINFILWGVYTKQYPDHFESH